MTRLQTTWFVLAFTCIGFHLYNRHIVIRHYYDVLMDEYKEYQEYLKHEKRLQLMRQGMVDVAQGLAEDIEDDLV